MISRRALLAGSATLAVTAVGLRAHALPAIGARAPEAHLEDADRKSLILRVPPGRPMLVLYEDKSSATQNRALKDDLAKLAEGDRYRTAIALVPVADVSAYDFWPVRGFVADAIRDESQKVKATIYCDWSGKFRAAFGFRRGVSNVVLVASDGRVLFASEGALDEATRRRLIGMMRALVDVPVGTAATAGK